MKRGIVPDHEDLRRAVRWLGDQPQRDAATIERASVRFDLSPTDEEFLLRHFRSDCPPASSSAGSSDRK